jgi:hypothetical protein
MSTTRALARAFGAPTRGRASSSSSSNHRRAMIARATPALDDDDASVSSSIETTLATTRRASLLALTTLATTTVATSSARASPFDELAAAKRRTNAKFLMGPVATSRARLAALRRDVSQNDVLDVVDARDALTKATLDCTTPRDALKAYSNARDVCTLSILARSVTKGPAARNADDSQESMAVYDALERAKDSFGVLEAAFERAFGDFDGGSSSSSSSMAPADASAVDAAFAAADAAMYDFALALAACFRFDAPAYDALREDVAGAFVEPL